MPAVPVASSFRDPAGHVLLFDDVLCRAVMPAGRADYEALRSSGLYDELAGERLLIEHEELPATSSIVPGAWRILQPRRVPFVSYPYEWPFSALKDAALLTLEIQKRALARGMALKDASAFNVQFVDGQPIFVDTLSFQTQQPGPWRAYRQFCQHFLSPLLLMSYTDMSLGQLFRIYPHGVPLSLASRLLSFRSWCSAGALLHVHLHAWAERRWGSRSSTKSRPHPRAGSEALVDSLRNAVASIKCRAQSHWADYDHARESYSEAQLASKIATVTSWLDELRPPVVWDLGANTGRFARYAACRGSFTLALDQDPACVELLYQAVRREKLARLQPLVVDLTRPTPGIGWANEERQTLPERGTADLLLALALVHHLAIDGNIPFDRMSSYFARLGRALIIEFVPKDDPMVQRLLNSRHDVFLNYSLQGFETAFSENFRIQRRTPAGDSGRMLYLMIRK